ncbi:hypothetical protein BGX38DRAFT_1141968 [Terfezia claveryi]|nr:hypothetical protein BGX38DRAFT_1141968 [Terfezia claveryi]
MNFKKVMMKAFLGATNGSALGTLSSFNKKLGRKYIDDKATNFWACMDFTRDYLEAILMGLIVAEGSASSWELFWRKCVNGDILWREVIKGVSKKLAYTYVSELRDGEEEKRDKVHENILLFVRMELEFRAFYKAILESDIGFMELILQIWGPQFLGSSNASKYGPELIDIRCGMLGEWNDQLKQIIRRNWVINPRGRRGKCLGLDEFMEELVRVYKYQYNPGGSEMLEDHQRNVIARCALHLIAVKDDLRCGLSIRRHSGNRVKQDSSADVKSLLGKLLEDDVVRFVRGRGGATIDYQAIEEVVDMMNSGLEKIRDGKWWPEFLSRSLGCSRMRVLRTLWLADQLELEDEQKEENEDYVEGMDVDL